MSNPGGALSFERPRLWMPVGAAILLLGLVLTFQRFSFGLGAVTNLTDQQPWGLWVGFDVLCGVALAAGGVVLTGVGPYFPALFWAISWSAWACFTTWASRGTSGMRWLCGTPTR